MCLGSKTSGLAQSADTLRRLAVWHSLLTRCLQGLLCPLLLVNISNIQQTSAPQSTSAWALDSAMSRHLPSSTCTHGNIQMHTVFMLS